MFIHLARRYTNFNTRFSHLIYRPSGLRVKYRFVYVFMALPDHGKTKASNL